MPSLDVGETTTATLDKINSALFEIGSTYYIGWSIYLEGEINLDNNTAYCSTPVSVISPPVGDYVVTTLADDGSAGSLREVIRNAQNDDVIVFDTSLYGKVIKLNEFEFYGELIIDKNITIDANGTGVIIAAKQVQHLLCGFLLAFS